MPVSLRDIDKTLKELLKPEDFVDFCPNGIQIEGKDEIERIVTGVTASRALVQAAIRDKADHILVHHGYFCKGEDKALHGLQKSRSQLCIRNDSSLYACHLP